jgi:hypothetical protein
MSATEPSKKSNYTRKCAGRRTKLTQLRQLIGGKKNFVPNSTVTKFHKNSIADLLLTFDPKFKDHAILSSSSLTLSS